MMKHACAWSLSLALAVAIPQSLRAEPMTNDETAVLETVATMTDAFQNADIKGVMNAYESGAVVLFEPGSQISKKSDLLAMFEAASGLKPIFEYSGHEVIVTGDTALHIAPWSMTGTLPDGSTIAQSGLSVAVLRRQDDGTWRLVIDNPHGSRLLAPLL